MSDAWAISGGQPAKDVATLALAATGGALLAKAIAGGLSKAVASHVVDVLLAVADDIGPAVDRLAKTTGLDRAPELEEVFAELRQML